MELDSGDVVTAHCVNTGPMEGLPKPGIRVWLSRSDNPARKLAYTWEMAELEGRVWGVNTMMPNRLVSHLLRGKRLPWLSHWHCFRSEKNYGERSRVDFWLCDYEDGEPDLAGLTPARINKLMDAREPVRQHFLEVKNCHLVYPDQIAYFPDCVSERATSHLRELKSSVGSMPAATAEVLFVIQVSGAQGLRPSDMHDPAFAAAARDCAAHGIRFSAIGVAQTEDQMTVYGPLPVDLDPYDLSPMEQWRMENA